MNKSIRIDQVDICGGFWKEEQKVVKESTIEAVYQRFDETGRNGALSCDWKEGMPNRPHIFWDSDVVKWLEGVAYFLQKERDAELEARVDELIRRMKENQLEDGYFNSYFITVEPDEKFKRRMDHELYCAGHMIEAAIAYYQATGKRDFLDVCIKYVDLIDRVFRIDHTASFDTPGHEEIELALIKLYRETRDEKHLLLAKYFIDKRGKSDKDTCHKHGDMEYLQSHIPVREQKEAVGHSVRALYLYTAMADLAIETGDKELETACETLFENLITKKMHITGGFGTTWRGEAFTYDYDLPEYTTYNETCASIAMAMFCRRMWLLQNDSRYADQAEYALYNTMLSGISLSGDHFFYENPLSANPDMIKFNESRAEGLRDHLPILERVRVFNCSCCPPNLVRSIGGIGEYLYSTDGDTLFAHCYADSKVNVKLGEKEVNVIQKTEYPFDGHIAFTMDCNEEFEFAFRIPGWCNNWEVKVNGKTVTYETIKGYVYLTQKWCQGDTVTLDLDMPYCLMEANPRVRDLAGRVAVKRGPIIYSAEGWDNPGILLRSVYLQEDTEFVESQQEISGRMIPIITVSAKQKSVCEDLYRPYSREMNSVSLKMIPYYAWANRGMTEMNTWFLIWL